MEATARTVVAATERATMMAARATGTGKKGDGNAGIDGNESNNGNNGNNKGDNDTKLVTKTTRTKR